MPIKIVAPTRKAHKGKAGTAKGQSYKKGGRTGKQFGGGFNQPLGGAAAPIRPGVRAPMRPGVGAAAPIRPPGFKHGKSVKKKKR